MARNSLVAVSTPRRAASPTGSDAGSEAASRASTDNVSSSLDALLGAASDDLEHDLQKRGLSPAWALAVKSTGSKISGDDIVNLSTFLIRRGPESLLSLMRGSFCFLL
jgi:BRCT domain type II-containing protein